MQGQDESQQSAELRQAFLRHLPKRLDGVRRRGRRLCQSGWDINALTLLFDEVQTLAGACGRYGLLDLGEKLFALERTLAPHIEQVRIPDAEQTAQVAQVLEALGPPAQSAAAGPGAPSVGTDDRVTLDGIPLQVVPPVDFIARFARPLEAANQPPPPEPVAEPEPERAPEPAPVIATVVAGMEQPPAAPAPAREDAPEAVAPRTAARAPREPAAPRGQGRRIFHLSDGQALSGELDQRLEGAGYALEILEGPDELKEMVRALSPNLVLVDASFLDEIEGVGQVVRTARARASHRIALMALSSSADVSLRLRAMRAGADSFIGLPASALDVMARINELVDADAAEPFRVMIIEDDRSQALFAESILRKAGMETIAVMDPLSALESLDGFDPELILMDLYMPNCDGMELTTLIRERERFINTPIVFLSGEHDTDKRFDALSAGGDDYLEKPIRPKYLISAVTNRVRRARAVNRRVQAHNPRDPVTGLYDRAYVIDRISETLASDESTTNLGGILFLIIDGAQAIRERIGLSAFDTLISQAGALLASLLAGTDLASRYGDTSFLILTPGRAEQELTKFGEEVRERFEKHVFEVGDKSLTLAISVGIATFARGWADAGAMLNAAERACAQARATPDRKVRVFVEPEVEQAANANDSLLGAIHDALKYDRFQLLFQPIASLRGTAEEQFQVLLRLKGDGGKLYTAADVVPFAEKAGMINAVDRWVLSRCLLVLQERDRLDKPVRLFVSQSVEAMLDAQRIGWIKQQLEARHVPADQLVLEFRVGDVLARLRQAVGFCETCKQVGIPVGLTGFEGSMASYQMLQHLPLDFIKVSGKYVGAGGQARETRNELRQLVAYAHERKVKIVAPMVEDAQAAAALWSTGVDFIQGNFVQQAGQDLEFDFRASAM
jgi:diguanylate cyclase (GGDEF)-like protein